MRLHDDEDEEQLADRVLLQTWREWRRKVSREVAEAEEVAAMERCPMFGGVVLRDLEREDRNTLSALFSGRLRGS